MSVPLLTRRAARRRPGADDPLRALAERVNATQDLARRDRGTRRRLRLAAGRPAFPVHYQPVVDLATGAVAAREALVRWQDTPDGPLRPPAAFIPLAEEMGVIVEIGRRILHRACRDAAAWRGEDGHAPAVHVNVSPVELRDPSFLAGLSAILEDSGLPAERLVLEFTAVLLADDGDACIRALHEARELGVGTALDRFGVGAVALEDLCTLPLDWLKVAPAFVHDLTSGGIGRAFVSLVLGLAERLDVCVIAEGIETRAQMSALRSLGVGHGQGYFLGLPTADPGPAFPIEELAARA